MQDSLHRERIFKVRVKGFLPGHGVKKVRQRGNEGMLVSQNVAGLPEAFSIRMIESRNGYAASALQISRLGRVEEVKLVHLIESETEHPLRAVHFKRIAVLAAHAITSCLEGANAAVSEADHQ